MFAFVNGIRLSFGETMQRIVIRLCVPFPRYPLLNTLWP